MLKEKYKLFYDELRKVLPGDRIYLDEVRKLAWGTDAGFYRLIPQMIVRSANEQEVVEAIKLCYKYNLPVTFRAAGTSLSGQAISDSVMLVAGKHWEDYSVSENAEEITVQCGIVGARINQILAKYGRKLGPDPASINSAMIGGIVMNNASGMNCGVHENSYRTIIGARIIFSDGTLLDTRNPESRENFKKTHADFISKIEEIKTRIRANQPLVERIRKKYSIKNTTGLSVNAFIDYDDPIQIIVNLLVGSEGTLAFASEFTLKTVVDQPFKASAMIYFSDIVTASKAVVKMKKGKKEVYGAELLDRLALKSVENQDGIPAYIKDFPDGVTAILVETKADDQEQLDKNIKIIEGLISDVPTIKPIHFTDKVEEYGKYWKIRKGIFPSVGGMRPLGTTCFIEDLAFQIDDLPAATDDLQKLIARHGYDEGVIYGHALEGNFHFIVNLDFDNPNEVKRYEALMKEVVDLVVNKYDGSLKAEHGTGRNMAPFVPVEWGDEIFGIMKEVKNLFDPKGLLNPGVIFNDDPDCYLKNFKSLTPTNKHVDKCIECGFCEINCLTNGFSLSSRQRIVVQREITRLKNLGIEPERRKELEEGFKYLGEQTCAGDGLCSTSCPVGINTGELIHDLRAINNQSFPNKQLGAYTAHNFGKITPIISNALAFVNTLHGVVGTKSFQALANSARYVSGNAIPLWTPAMPKGIKRPIVQPVNSDNPLKVVYFPSCINQTMGPASGDPDQMPLHLKLLELLKKAGYEVIYPERMKSLCCGTIWESKGFYKEADEKSSELEESLLVASRNGKYPVLCDQSPCLYRMRHTMGKPLKLYEPVEFIHEFLMDKLNFTKTDDPISIHVTCSMTKMGLAEKTINLARACSNNVLVPEEVGCCGFAGDKGFTHPEINKYALRKLRPQIEAKKVKYGYSNSRTCEIGLTTHSGVPYQSIVYLVDQCSEKK
ncbi:MAG: FAD-binding and (Fe-S)-binding domain-containing protein [Bacteroidales bacterium]|nr:FAD-binding and (Fe-S)-binding domain-containing protein [Bacteroidales bacterium]